MFPSGLRYNTERWRRRVRGAREKKHNNQKESNNKESLSPFQTVTPNFFEDIDYSLFTQVSPIEEEMVTSLITPEQWKVFQDSIHCFLKK